MNASNSPLVVVIKLILRWWWLVAVCVALGAIVGFLIRRSQPDVYYASASVFFGQSFSAVGEVDTRGSFDSMFIAAGLVRLDRYLQPVIENLGLEDSVEDLNARMQVVESNRLPILEIIVGDVDREQAANIANAVAQSLIDQSPNRQEIQDAEFLREQLRQVASQISQLETQYNDLLNRGSTLTSAFEITQNQLQIESIAATLGDLRNLYADLNANAPQGGNLISIFQPASPQFARVVTGSMASVIFSAVGGLALSLATIVLMAYLDDRLQWHENMETVEGVRVLGPLGLVPRNKLPLYLATMPNSVEAEVLRQLRAKLVLMNNGRHPSMLTVTSYDSGDGKTVTTANIALACAEAGLRTVLVDGDIRKGNIHEFFRLPNIMGLSDILAGRDDLHLLLSRALLDSGYENLTIMTAGRATADAASLLSRPRFSQLTNALKEQFDAVVFDSVPTIGGPDSAFLAEQSDGVLIVLHGQRTTHRALRRVVNHLTESGKRDIVIFGVVFNRVVLQATSSYNKPYYRRQLSVNVDHLNQELISGKKRSLFARRNILLEKDGVRLYSLPAASVHLGVSEDTLNEWVSAGYIRVERRRGKNWVSEHEMRDLLDRLPRYEYELPAPQPADGNAPTVMRRPITGKQVTGQLRDLIVNQREQVLETAREESKEASED